MDIPASVGTSIIDARMLKASLDNIDVGSRPQAKEIDGLTVTLTPSREQIKVTDPPMELWLEPIVLGGNQVGRLVNHRSLDEPIEIVASDPFGDHLIDWAVLVEAPGWKPRRMTLVAAAGSTVDLAEALPGDPPSPSAVFVSLTEPSVGSGWLWWLDASPTPVAPGMDPGTGNLTYYAGGR